MPPKKKKFSFFDYHSNRTRAFWRNLGEGLMAFGGIGIGVAALEESKIATFVLLGIAGLGKFLVQFMPHDETLEEEKNVGTN